MKEMLSRKKLERLRFKIVREVSGAKGKGYYFEHNGLFSVTLFKKDKENPLISMIIHNTRVDFPGAYTEKDLRDLLFMYYGEEKYTEMFGHLPAVIVE